MNVLGLLGAAIGLFAVTNVDDLFLLGLFFSDPTLRRSQVVAGQFLGIGILVAISVLRASLSIAVPEAWIALLGIVPLALGIWKLRLLWKPDSDEPPASVSQSGMLAVSGVTVANGGDNLGVYISYFATLAMWEVSLTVAVFLAMTAAWCLIAFWLVRHRHVGKLVERFGHVLLPPVLIGLGFWILKGAVQLVSAL